MRGTRNRITRRIVAAALGFALPLAVLTGILVQHERGEIEATRRERAGLTHARAVIDVLTAIRVLRLQDARCGGDGGCAERGTTLERVDGALEALARVHAELGDALGGDTSIGRGTAQDEPEALLARWRRERIALEIDPSARGVAEDADVELADATLEDFAALRLPGDQTAERADPLLELERAASALLARSVARSGLAADRDRDSDAVIDGALGVLPLLGGDVTHLAIARARPGFGTSAESSFIAQLVRDRQIPELLERLDTAIAEDDDAWGRDEALQQVAPTIATSLAPSIVELADTVPAFDDEERREYLARGEALVENVGATSAELAGVAESLLGRRESALARRLAVSLALVALITLLTLLVVLRTIRALMRPLSELAEGARRFAAGELDTRLAVRSHDEIGAVTEAFNQMAEAIAVRDARLHGHAVQLEGRVAAKTEALQAILDSMGEGLLVTDVEGRLQPERSRLIEEWLGPLEPGQPIGEYLARDDRDLADAFQLGIEEIASDLLPFELLAAQMPRSLSIGERELRLAYRVARRGDGERRVVVTLRDATNEIARERLDRRHRELTAVVPALLGARTWFESSIEEIEQLLADAGDPELAGATRTRAIHTIKGCSAMLGFASFADACHRLEDALEEQRSEAPDADRVALLRAEWDAALAPVRPMLSSRRDVVEITGDEHLGFVEALERGADRDALIDEARSWARDRIGDAVRPLVLRAEQLAARLGKRVRVEVLDAERRMPDGPYRTFLTTLVHVVANAVLHGVEMPSERARRGKPDVATITLAIDEPEPGRVHVRVSDDGGGIDWDRVRAAAAARGAPSSEHHHLVEALFTDGVSTAREVCDVAGRGVGLAAVAAACERLQGRFEVTSHEGLGTTFVFELHGVPITGVMARPVAAAVA